MFCVLPDSAQEAGYAKIGPLYARASNNVRGINCEQICALWLQCDYNKTAKKLGLSNTWPMMSLTGCQCIFVPDISIATIIVDYFITLICYLESWRWLHVHMRWCLYSAYLHILNFGLQIRAETLIFSSTSNLPFSKVAPAARICFSCLHMEKDYPVYKSNM